VSVGFVQIIVDRFSTYRWC